MSLTAKSKNTKPEVSGKIGFSRERELWSFNNLRPGRQNELLLNGIVV